VNSPSQGSYGPPDVPAPQVRGTRKRQALVKLLVGLLILAFLFRTADFGELELSWDARTAGFLLLGIICIGGALVLSSVRWWVVLWSRSCSFPELFRAYLLGWLSSLFLPSTVAGDAVRVAVVARGNTGAGAAVSSIVLERSLGLGALVLCLLVGLFLAPAAFLAPAGLIRWDVTLTQALAVTALILAVSALLWTQRYRMRSVVDALSDAISVWSRFGRSPGRMAAAAGVALGVQALYIAAWWGFAHALAIPLSWEALLVYVPLVSLVALLPVTMAGLGVREGAWVILLAPLGAPMAGVVTFSLLYYVSTLLVALFLAGLMFVVLPALFGTDATGGMDPTSEPAREVADGQSA
jgi:glycosyltransferase 2 family protein